MSAYDVLVEGLSGLVAHWRESDTVSANWAVHDFGPHGINTNFTSGGATNVSGLISGDPSTALQWSSTLPGIMGGFWPTANNPFTCLAWVKLANHTGGGIIGWGGPIFNGDNNAGIFLDGSGRVGLMVNTSLIVTGVTTLILGQVYLVGVDWDGSTARAWLNANVDASAAHTALNVANATFTIAGFQNNGGINFSGNTSQKIALFNRLLTQSEWTSIYNAGLGISAAKGGPASMGAMALMGRPGPVLMG